MPITNKTQLTLHLHMCDPKVCSKSCGHSCYYNLCTYIYIYNVTLLGGGVVCVCLQYIIYTEILYCVCDPTDGIVTGAVMMRLVLAVVWRGERTRFACLTSQTECAII